MAHPHNRYPASDALLRISTYSVSTLSLDTESLQTEGPHLYTNMSDSTATFVPGLGSLAGKFIYAVGKAEVRGMKALWMINRRRKINAKFPHSDPAKI